jgi:hypothetical protein
MKVKGEATLPSPSYCELKTGPFSFKIRNWTLFSRVSGPHPFHADKDLGFQIFENPIPGFEMFEGSGSRILFFVSPNLYFLREKSKKRTFDLDQNADPDPGTFKNADPDTGTSKMRFQIRNPALFKQF